MAGRDPALIGPAHLAFYLTDLQGGGVQKRMLTLANALAERGHAIELVLCRKEGPLLAEVAPGMTVTPLSPGPMWRGRLAALRADPGGLLSLLLPVLLARKPSWTLAYLPALADYLRRVQPQALLVAKPHPNLEALWARRLAGAEVPILVSERISLLDKIRESKLWKRRFLPALLRRNYRHAEAVVAVSNGLAEEVAEVAALPRARVTTIYNPVVTPMLLRNAQAPLDHPWFASGSPPVILGAGRIHDDKDFATLIKAFARVRAQRDVRLMILGDAKKVSRLDALKTLAAAQGVGHAVAFPGFVDNPLPYMARAAIFVLSSIREGLPGVLIEALACSCPVVSTDCPNGPAEILEAGKFGRLVPVGDDAAMAAAIVETLDEPPNREKLRARGADFSLDCAVTRYLEVLEIAKAGNNAP